MADRSKKSKSGVFLFFGALVIIFFIMIISDYRSDLMFEFPSPKKGVKQLVTLGNKLIAVSGENEIYVWDWSDLPAIYKTGMIEADKVNAVSGGNFIAVDPRKNLLIVTSLRENKPLKQLLLPLGKRCTKLKVSPNGINTVIALQTSRSSDNDFQIAVTDNSLSTLSEVITKNKEDKLVLNDIAITNDGKYIVATGKSDAGWMLVADAGRKTVVWEKVIPDSAKLDLVTFSPDGQMIYASTSSRNVGIFKTATGELVKKLEIEKYKTPLNNPQTISCINISPDSRLLAVSSVPASKIWLWDAKTGERIAVIGPGQFTVISLAFSPDSSLLASGDLIGKVQIKVWSISDEY